MAESLFRIQTRTQFHEALLAAIEEAAYGGWPELRLCDGDYADWPLGDRRFVAALERWVTSRRRLVLLASTFDDVARRHARWVAWRKPWSHVVECRVNEEASELPCLLHAPGNLHLELVDRTTYRGTVSRERSDLVRGREIFDAVLQRSMPAFPATTAGL
ncbi:MAG: hypothetical protein JSR59_09585 [Proteobacteria bacterium]|nr:hypothetical protein [Pseudomonadota bacterium]